MCPGRLRRVPEGPQGTPGGPREVAGTFLDVPWVIPGGPWEVPKAQGILKGSVFGDGSPFCGIPVCPKRSPGHLQGVSARSPGSPVAFLGIPGESLGGPRAQGGLVFGH